MPLILKYLYVHYFHICKKKHKQPQAGKLTLPSASISLPRIPQPIAIHAKRSTPGKRIASFAQPPSEPILAISPHASGQHDAPEIRPAGGDPDAAAEEAVHDGAEMDVAAQPGGRQGRARGQAGRGIPPHAQLQGERVADHDARAPAGEAGHAVGDGGEDVGILGCEVRRGV